MAGAYSHITLVNELSSISRLKNLGLPKNAIKAIGGHYEFCEMGSISPDYPYLKILDKDAQRWSELMHHKIDQGREGNLLHVGIRHLRELKGEKKNKCFSWFLGYASHVATDVTVHPVVNLKVGPYERNKTAHRVCEMNQDTYIYNGRLRLDIGISEQLEQNIGSCVDKDDKEKIDRDIDLFWNAILAEVFPVEYEENRPDISSWHNAVQFLIGKFAEEGERFIPFARHVCSRRGLVYPTVKEVKKGEYIERLKTPTGYMSYDKIFDFAVKNVGEVWKTISEGVFRRDEQYLVKLGIWNLDSGKDEKKKSVFWV